MKGSKIRMKNVVVLSLVGLLFLFGCSSAPVAQKENEAKAAKKSEPKDRQAAMQLFIDGSLKESKEQYADAILDYQEALKYDQNDAIYYALAKNYLQLKRFASAIENGREAVRLAPENLEYRQLLAGIYINSGNFDSALQEYREIVKRDSNNVQALFPLAQLSERTRPLEALKLYQRILSLNGPSWEVLLQIAQLNSILRRYSDAAVTFEQMYALDPGNIALKQNAADMYLQAKKPEKAKEALQEILEKNPENIDVNASMAEFYIQQNDWKSAEPYLSKILKNDSLDANFRFRIGVAYYTESLKDTTLVPKTYEIFQDYVNHYPDDWRALLYAGVLGRAVKKDSLAQKYLEKATQIANWNPDVWWQLGWLFFDKNNFSEAVSIMEKAKQYLPDEFRVYLLLGIAYSRAGREEDARVALERAVELNPKDINALSSLGLTYDNLKMSAESDSCYERALRVDPDYALVLNNYAYSLSVRNIHLDRAMKMSKRALEKDSLNSSYLDTYGWILFQKEQYDDARIYIAKAVEQGDASSVVLEHLGDVYAKLNQPDEAKKYWSRALELDAKNTALKEKLEQYSK